MFRSSSGIVVVESGFRSEPSDCIWYSPVLPRNTIVESIFTHAFEPIIPIVSEILRSVPSPAGSPWTTHRLREVAQIM